MRIRANITCNADDLQAMRRRAVQMVLEAEGAVHAYKESLEVYWEKWFESEVGDEAGTTQDTEFLILLDGDTEYTHVKAVKVYADWDARPVLRFVEKTSAGKWKKTHTEYFLPCPIKRLAIQ